MSRPRGSGRGASRTVVNGGDMRSWIEVLARIGYAARGVTHIDMPATPERVWRAIREARAA